ncbi:unnamed protein product, partial [Symbiodinium pilosum]
MKSVMVDVDGVEEEVLVDDECGPVMHNPDRGRLIQSSPPWLQAILLATGPDQGRIFARVNYTQAERQGGFHTDRAEKTWPYLTSTERKVLLHMVAKINRQMKDRLEPTQRPPLKLRPPAAGKLRDLYKLLGRTDDDDFTLESDPSELPSSAD